MILDKGSLSIFLRRGDTAYFNIKIQPVSSFIDFSDMTIYMTVRKPSDGRKIIEKFISELTPDNSSPPIYSGVFSFIPSDTENKDFGRYIYDIELHAGSLIKHIIPPNDNTPLPDFWLTEDATNDR